MKTEVVTRYCPHCGERTATERTLIELGFGGWLLAFLTLGLWIFVRAIFHNSTCRCLICGKTREV